MYTYIDLFAGAGGMSLGFDKAGLKNVFSIDIEPTFCQTYRTNFPSHNLIQGNIALLSAEKISDLIKNNEIDVIIGGPPCQGFSIAGHIGRKFVDDDRNKLFLEYARVVSIIRPKFFVMENVARLYTHNNNTTKAEIINKFNQLGYYVECKIVNAADYGVPQIRNRVLFIGSRISKQILFPKKDVDQYKTVKETIDHYPVLNSGESSLVANHIAMKHTNQMLKKMSYISDGGDRYEIPENIRPKSGDVRKYIRYKSEEPSICITGDMRKVFHYNQNRALTVRELAAIQTFPDDFLFDGPVISQQQQVGNAVPPKLAYAIAKVIIEQLDQYAK